MIHSDDTPVRMPLAAVGSSWLSEPVFKRNTLYNFCAPENFSNPCNLSGASSLTTHHLHNHIVCNLRAHVIRCWPTFTAHPPVERRVMVQPAASPSFPTPTFHGTSTGQMNIKLQSKGKTNSGLSTSVLPRPKFDDLPRTGTTPSQPLPHHACRENIG